MPNYRLITHIVAPLVPLWLHYRKWRGKEDAVRFKERFGIASQPRPQGTLLWMHAASVGEANSVVPLLLAIRARFPHITILMTTGTVTSAKLMRERLPEGIIHQYVPIDTPRATQRFIWHWRPDFAFWVESEFWPNLLTATNELGSFMGVINARMSERSFRSWQKHPAMIKSMLTAFDVIFAQSADDASRLRALGAKDPITTGNLKYDAPALSCDEGELATLKIAIGTRPVWLAASTHPGEETLIGEAHKLLSMTRPNLLTIIVPRHPARGDAIASELQKHGKIVQRSKRDALTTDTSIYIADTLGELGLFYRLSEIVFMGGSLVAHGGQNPLEPARLSCAIVSGTHTHNFADMYSEMEQAGGILRVQNMAGLAAQIDRLLGDTKARDALQNATRAWLKDKGGASDVILDTLEPALAIQRAAR